MSDFQSADDEFLEVEQVFVKKKKKYSVDELNEAINYIHNGSSVYAASKRYNIPKSTLHDHIEGKNKGNRGRKPIFSVETEKEIAKWIVKCAERGGPITKEQLLETVGRIRKQSGDENAAVPSIKWLNNFMKRNDWLSYRIAHPVTHSSACVSEADIRRWFNRIHAYLSKENLLHLLSDSARWINCDETGFELNPKAGKVLAGKGAKVVNYVETAHPSERVSVMYTFGADGHFYSPQMILKNSVSGNKIHNMASTSVGEENLI